jgi:hypothetical protein
MHLLVGRKHSCFFWTLRQHGHIFRQSRPLFVFLQNTPEQANLEVHCAPRDAVSNALALILGDFRRRDPSQSGFTKETTQCPAALPIGDVGFFRRVQLAMLDISVRRGVERLLGRRSTAAGLSFGDRGQLFLFAP